MILLGRREVWAKSIQGAALGGVLDIVGPLRDLKEQKLEKVCTAPC